MNTETIITGVLIGESSTFTVTEVCHKYHIPKELLLEMVEEGLFSNQSTEPEKITLDSIALRRIETAFRLHRDLEINLPGIALALDLLDEMDKMRHELEILRKHF